MLQPEDYISPSIDHVAHYHLPASADFFRFIDQVELELVRKGVSFMFCSPQEFYSGPLSKIKATSCK